MDKKSGTPIPIHIVSVGDGIPYAHKVFEGHTYTWAPGYDALRAALVPPSNVNVLLLNVAPVDYQTCLDVNESFIRERNPLIVAPEDYRGQVSKALVAKYGIKFVSFFGEHGLLDMPENLQPLLRERAQETAR